MAHVSGDKYDRGAPFLALFARSGGLREAGTTTRQSHQAKPLRCQLPCVPPFDCAQGRLRKPRDVGHPPFLLRTQLEPIEPRWPIPTAGDLGHPAREVEYAVENAMTLSPAEIAQIRAETKRLEEARDECNDGGIRQQIEAWSKELKQKVESEQSKR